MGQFDHIVSHFDGNNNDRDDIAALPMAAMITNAAGFEDKSTFFYNNNLGEPNSSSQVDDMRKSAAFAEKLGIQTHDYQANTNAATTALVEILDSGQKVLAIEGGPMEAIYRALAQTSPANRQNVTLLSHSGWNENRDIASRPGVNNVHTWADIRNDYPEVELVEIRDQNAGHNNDTGFNNRGWAWLDNATDPVFQEARELMQNARYATNDPSDAGMHFYALTGQEAAEPTDARSLFNDYPPAFASSPTPTPDPDPEPTPTPNPNPSPDGETLRVEAETMQLSGNYDVESLGVASGGKGISLIGGPSNETGSAKMTFNGDDGLYDVRIAYFDENDGVGQLEVMQGNNSLAAFDLDQQLGSRFADNQTLTSRVIEGVNIKSGDVFTINGVEDGTPTTAEHARVDYVEFIPRGRSNPTPEPTPEPDPVADEPLMRFALVDAETDNVVKGFENLGANGEIDLKGLDLDQYNLVAQINADHPEADSVKSVKFESSLGDRIENVKPYALFGDIEGDFKGKALNTGDYTVKATAYTNAGGKGSAIAASTLDYTVVDTTSSGPTPGPTPTPDPTPTPGNGNGVFQAEDGQLVLEAESANLTGDWQSVTVQGEKSVLWDAARSSYGKVPEGQTLSYQFAMDESGTYSIALRSGRIKSVMNQSDRFEHGKERTDTGNDAYVSLVNADTGEVVQQPTKLFTGLGSSDRELRWGGTFDANHKKSPAQVSLAANTRYRLEISGRSDGYVLDRITLSNDGPLKDTERPQSPLVADGLLAQSAQAANSPAVDDVSFEMDAVNAALMGSGSETDGQSQVALFGDALAVDTSTSPLEVDAMPKVGVI